MLLFHKLNQTRQILHRIRPPTLHLCLFIWQKVACEHNPAMMAVNVIEERTSECRNIIYRRQGCLFNTQTLDKTKQRCNATRQLLLSSALSVMSLLCIHYHLESSLCIGIFDFVWDRTRLRRKTMKDNDLSWEKGLRLHPFFSFFYFVHPFSVVHLPT